MSEETIARVEAFPLRYAEPNNNGKIRHITLVRLETAGGAVGWGEAITGTDDASLAMKVIVDRGFAPRLIGRDPRDVEAVWSEFRETTYWTGNGGIVTFAISAIDMAMWDLAGRIAGLPLHRLLGGKRRDRVRAASSVIFDTADLAGIGRQFADLRARGYQVLKGGWGHDLSIAFGRDAKRDLAIVRTVREAVGDDAEIIVDVAAGSGWTASHAITMARAFEPYRLYWLEDALAEGDWRGWQRLRAATATPLCTGEKGWTVPHFRGLIESGALDVVMIDPGRAEGRHRHEEGDRPCRRCRHRLERPFLVERDQHRRLAASRRGVGERPPPRAQAGTLADAGRAGHRPDRDEGRVDRGPRCAGAGRHGRRGGGAAVWVCLNRRTGFRQSSFFVPRTVNVMLIDADPGRRRGRKGPWASPRRGE